MEVTSICDSLVASFYKSEKEALTVAFVSKPGMSADQQLENYIGEWKRMGYAIGYHKVVPFSDAVLGASVIVRTIP